MADPKTLIEHIECIQNLVGRNEHKSDVLSALITLHRLASASAAADIHYSNDKMAPLQLLPGFVERLKSNSGDHDERVAAMLERITEEKPDLDELVYELKSAQAADINNEGVEAQLDCLIAFGGLAWAEDAIFNKS